MKEPPECVSIHIVTTSDVVHYLNRVVGSCHYVILVGHILLPLVLFLHPLGALHDSILESHDVVGIGHMSFITEDERQVSHLRVVLTDGITYQVHQSAM